MPRFPVRIWARWGMGLLLVAAINTIATSISFAQPAQTTGTTAARETPKEHSDPAPKLPDKKIKFSMDSKKWENVFAWLTQETGIPILANSYPQGSFSFQSPPQKEYTLNEIVDII